MGGRSLYIGLFLGAAITIAAPLSLAVAAGPVPDAKIFSKASPPFYDHMILAQASGGAGAQSFVQNMADEAIGFLGSQGMSHEQKKNAFRKLLQDSFDMKTIGRFALGRYWRVATPAERDEYQKLFEKMVIDVYSSRFAEYQGQSFETRGFREDGAKDTLVTSFIVPKDGPEIQVDWRVRNKDGRYKVVDIMVEGVSMSVTQRSDFSSVIQRGGGSVSALLTHLRALQ